jgi:uncharacterized membrane protein
MHDAFLKSRSSFWMSRVLTSAALAALAVGCATDAEQASEEADDVLGQLLDAGPALDGGPVSDAGVAPDAAQADAGAPAGASFCEVLTIMKARCQACHGAETAAGAPMSLVTYEDFQAEAVLTPGKKVYEVTQARMHDTRRPMPPRGVRPAAELNVVDSWVAAGAPAPATPCP